MLLDDWSPCVRCVRERLARFDFGAIDVVSIPKPLDDFADVLQLEKHSDRGPFLDPVTPLDSSPVWEISKSNAQPLSSKPCARALEILSTVQGKSKRSSVKVCKWSFTKESRQVLKRHPTVLRARWTGIGITKSRSVQSPTCRRTQSKSIPTEPRLPINRATPLTQGLASKTFCDQCSTWTGPWRGLSRSSASCPWVVLLAGVALWQHDSHRSSGRHQGQRAGARVPWPSDSVVARPLTQSVVVRGMRRMVERTEVEAATQPEYRRCCSLARTSACCAD